MRRETQHVLLVLLGGALLRIAADDTYLRYVRPSHRWLLLGAGAVIVVLAVVALLRDRAPAPDAHPHGDHGGAERHAPWLLLAPVLVIALVAPPALGADAVARAGPRNAVVQASDVFAPLPPGDPVELGVAEFVERAVWDTTGTLHGRKVVLTGFAVRRGAATELARMTIACCAADARPNRVRLVGDAGDPAPDTWLRVRGVLQEGSAGPDQVPALEVRGVEQVPAPSDPYEY
ncbi:TIGR03943 family putative permease subunit [Pseudonocardia kunmingensis]|uniref:Putative repeat protein (TIGR03943 family) n=1 Tax=Pseudonocardia kunmingensis TaxID=630975 RepID=A0A543DA47_9PSEU|nr:TIGR03943 family protein [Pseudonocardia kunmingensis]TQM06165.1 putative repeat protein (TIGR03943 family) [Pseudonocardia kunmingensis]